MGYARGCAVLVSLFGRLDTCKALEAAILIPKIKKEESGI